MEGLLVPDYDIVVFGATGFTGRQAAEYLDDHADAPMRWAIAGRNANKLAEVRAALHTQPDTIVADADDAVAIDAMVARTRVVLTTAGPFARYGEALLAACAARGVD